MKILVGHSSIKKSDTVLDIGAGTGVITSVLASRCNNVIAYEKDGRMVKKLNENMKSLKNVVTVEKDFLEESLPEDKYKVFSNIPFHLSSPILKKLTESDHLATAIYLIVQKQFANKLLIDGRRFTGVIGASIAPLYSVRIRKRLQKKDFWPHPAVETVLIELLLRDTPLIPINRMRAYRKFIQDSYHDPKTFDRLPLLEVDVQIDIKPSQLTLEEWLKLFSIQKFY